MGIKLLLLLGLLIGVLYCLHILAQDYQAITGPKLLRLIFKRDINYTKHLPSVRWKEILKYDTIQCARHLYCDLGARLPDNDLRRGLIYMISLKPQEEDKTAFKEYETAYFQGGLFRNYPRQCTKMYPICPLNASSLLDLLSYLLHRT